MNNFIKSPFKYTGRKHSILDQIIPHFPDLKEHKTFVDVFAGSGDVSINIPTGIDIIWNDIQTPLISCFIELHQYSNHIEQVKKNGCLEVPLSLNMKSYCETKEAYYEIRKRYNEFPTACNLLMLSYMSFNNMVRFNSKDKFNVPYGNRTFSEEDLTILDQFVEALQDRYIYFCSLEFDVLIDRILNNYSKSEVKPFLYLDPPYLITSAPYSRYWNQDKERLLYQRLNELSNNGFKWALSNVIEHNGKENDALSWFLSIEEDRTKVIEIDKSYNFSSGRKRNKKESREILVLNY